MSSSCIYTAPPDCPVGTLRTTEIVPDDSRQMTRDQALHAALEALKALQVICRDYGDLELARVAMEARMALERAR